MWKSHLCLTWPQPCWPPPLLTHSPRRPSCSPCSARRRRCSRSRPPAGSSPAVATKEAVPTLAALLGDEKLSHMARYALEAIPDPSVDDALRDALGKLQGRPRLGVIGSLGVRRDAKAVDALANC